MKKYILSPQYALRHGKNKTFIISHQGYGEQSRISIIHPIFAMMLSFFNGMSKENIYNKIAKTFNLSFNVISSHFDKLIENKDYVECAKSIFPPFLIVEYKDGMPLHNYKYQDFKYDSIDLTMSRLEAPVDIICNLTLKCATSCIYCYADRKNHQDLHMSLDLIDDIIEQAKEIGVLRFKLMGGEIMLYKGWEHIVSKLVNYGFQPDISIKKPMSENDILKWKEIGATLDPIQISLDTLIKEHLYQILKVHDPYYDNIKNTFKLLDKHQINYVVHTVINKFNDSIEDMKSLFDFFRERSFLKNWMFDAAKCSMYNGLEYKDYKTTVRNLREIGYYIDEIDKSNIFPFKLFKPLVLKDFNLMSVEEKQKKFATRTMCSGNLNALYILPDGQVSICEELYWHPQFIIGDLKKQSLVEIWNSEKALNLFYLKQSMIPKDSPCSNCQDFLECRKYKHVCWRDTILAYGPDKWYFPDISCPRAPKILKDISIEEVVRK